MKDLFRFLFSSIGIYFSGLIVYAAIRSMNGQIALPDVAVMIPFGILSLIAGYYLTED